MTKWSRMEIFTRHLLARDRDVKADVNGESIHHHGIIPEQGIWSPLSSALEGEELVHLLRCCHGLCFLVDPRLTGHNKFIVLSSTAGE